MTPHHLQNQINQARASKQALRIRGGGSKDFYGNALGNFAVLDTRSYSGICSYEPSELVVTARAGTPLAELEAALLEKNQYLPFEPPSFSQGASTVGGMVAAGLSGAARASCGSVRDHILGVQIVSGAGEVLRFGGTVMKNVAGYDVSRLLAGSMGTLALIAEVSLKVLPIPVEDATLRCQIGQAGALKLLNQWRAQPLPINSTAWVPDGTTTPPADYLFVRLRGAKATVSSGLALIKKDVQAAGGAAALMETVAAAQDWRKANSHQLPFFTQAPTADVCLWRLSLPAATPALDLSQVGDPAQYIEWQGAQRWLWATAANGATLKTMASKLGGHAVLFRASQKYGDADKASSVFQKQSAVLETLNQRLRHELDPHQIFNTKRMSP